MCLSIKSRILLPRYFNVDIEKTKKDIISSIKNDLENKDSVDIKKALLLCRNYTSFMVSNSSFNYANKYLKELDFLNYDIKDSIVQLLNEY